MSSNDEKSEKSNKSLNESVNGIQRISPNEKKSLNNLSKLKPNSKPQDGDSLSGINKIAPPKTNTPKNDAEKKTRNKDN